MGPRRNPQERLTTGGSNGEAAGATAEVLAAIPHRPPFLFVDAVRERRADAIVCERTFREDEGFYAGHYPAQPVTPGVLLCEAAFQTAAVFLAGRAGTGATGGVPDDTAGGTPLLCRVENARFRRRVPPGETVLIEARLRERLGAFFFFDAKITTTAGAAILTLSFAITLANE